MLEREFEEEFRNMRSHFKESCGEKGKAQVDDTGGAKGNNGNEVRDKAGEGTGAAEPNAETPEKKGCTGPKVVVRAMAVPTRRGARWTTRTTLARRS